MSVAIELISQIASPIETRRQERRASRSEQERLYLQMQEAVFKTTADLNKIRSMHPLYQGAITQFMSFPHFLRSMDTLWDDVSLLSGALGRLRLAGCPPATWQAAGDLGEAASQFPAIVSPPPRWRPAAVRANQEAWDKAVNDLGIAMTTWIDAVQQERAKVPRLRRWWGHVKQRLQSARSLPDVRDTDSTTSNYGDSRP